MCITLRIPTCKRTESWGGVANFGQKYLVWHTDGLVDPIVIGSAFHVTRELASKVGHQHYNLALGVIGGGRRELANLGFRVLEQIL